MANRWITDLRHFLPASGTIADLPGSARRLTQYLAAIVEAVTSGRWPRTGVKCRRRPGRRPCEGEILARLADSEPCIEWMCPACNILQDETPLLSECSPSCKHRAYFQYACIQLLAVTAQLTVAEIIRQHVLEEIRWLGKDRICEVHIKDNPHYLGQGSIDLTGVIAALAEIGFERWTVLETSSPSHDIVADMRKNRGFFQGLMTDYNRAG